MLDINLRIQLQGPSNVQQIASQTNAQLQSAIKPINVQINIDQNGVAQIRQLQQTATQLSQTLGQTAQAATQAGQAIQTAVASTGNISQNLTTLSNTANITSFALKNLSSSFKATSSEAFLFGEQTGLATRRFLAFSIGAGTVISALLAVKNGFADVIKFQNEMVRFLQISGDSFSSIERIADTVFNLSRQFGVSALELQQAAVVIRQAGRSAAETEVILKALAQAAASPNFDTLETTAVSAIAVLNQFNLSADKLAATFGSINAVASDFAVSAKDIQDAIQRSGGVYASLGGNLNEFIALFSSVKNVSQESSESIATGLRTIFTRLQRPETVDALRELNVQLRFTREQAQSLGQVNLTNQFIGPYQAIRQISEALKQIPITDPRYNRILEIIGGTRQIGRTLPLLTQTGTQERALALAQAGTLSLESSSEKAQLSLIRRTTAVTETFKELFKVIVTSPSFQQFAHAFLSVAESFGKALQYAAPLIPVLTTLAAIKFTSGLGDFSRGLYQTFTQPRGTGAGGQYTYIPRNFARGGFASSGPAMVQSGEAIIPFASGGVYTPPSDRVSYVPGDLGATTDNVYANLPNSFVLTKRVAQNPIVKSILSGYAGGGEFIRLYRSGKLPKEYISHNLPDFIKESEEYKKQMAIQGRFFSDDLETQPFYMQENDSPVRYIDILKDLAKKFHITNAPIENQQFSLDKNTEYLLPVDLANKAELLDDPKDLSKLIKFAREQKRFANGGLSLQDKSITVAKIKQLAALKNEYSPLFDKITNDDLSYVPSNAEFIGSGQLALAFRESSGSVLRVQPGLKSLNFLPADVSNFVRPNISGLLQNSASKIFTSSDLLGRSRLSLVERLPYTPAIANQRTLLGQTTSAGYPKYNLTDEDIEQYVQLGLLLQSQGYGHTDLHFGNVGYSNNQLNVIDPGGLYKLAKNEQFHPLYFKDRFPTQVARFAFGDIFSSIKSKLFGSVSNTTPLSALENPKGLKDVNLAINQSYANTIQKINKELGLSGISGGLFDKNFDVLMRNLGSKDYGQFENLSSKLNVYLQQALYLAGRAEVPGAFEILSAKQAQLSELQGSISSYQLQNNLPIAKFAPVIPDTYGKKGSSLIYLNTINDLIKSGFSQKEIPDYLAYQYGIKRTTAQNYLRRFRKLPTAEFAPPIPEAIPYAIPYASFAPPFANGGLSTPNAMVMSGEAIIPRSLFHAFGGLSGLTQLNATGRVEHLRNNEVPIIAEKGEYIVPKEKVNRYHKGGLVGYAEGDEYRLLPTSAQEDLVIAVNQIARINQAITSNLGDVYNVSRIVGSSFDAPKFGNVKSYTSQRLATELNRPFEAATRQTVPLGPYSIEGETFIPPANKEFVNVLKELDEIKLNDLRKFAAEIAQAAYVRTGERLGYQIPGPNDRGRGQYIDTFTTQAFREMQNLGLSTDRPTLQNDLLKEILSQTFFISPNVAANYVRREREAIYNQQAYPSPIGPINTSPLTPSGDYSSPIGPPVPGYFPNYRRDIGDLAGFTSQNFGYIITGEPPFLNIDTLTAYEVPRPGGPNAPQTRGRVDYPREVDALYETHKKSLEEYFTKQVKAEFKNLTAAEQKAIVNAKLVDVESATYKLANNRLSIENELSNQYKLRQQGFSGQFSGNIGAYAQSRQKQVQLELENIELRKSLPYQYDASGNVARIGPESTSLSFRDRIRNFFSREDRLGLQVGLGVASGLGNLALEPFGRYAGTSDEAIIRDRQSAYVASRAISGGLGFGATTGALALGIPGIGLPVAAGITVAGAAYGAIQQGIEAKKELDISEASLAITRLTTSFNTLITSSERLNGRLNSLDIDNLTSLNDLIAKQTNQQYNIRSGNIPGGFEAFIKGPIAFPYNIINEYRQGHSFRDALLRSGAFSAGGGFASLLGDNVQDTIERTENVNQRQSRLLSIIRENPNVLANDLRLFNSRLSNINLSRRGQSSSDLLYNIEQDAQSDPNLRSSLERIYTSYGFVNSRQFVNSSEGRALAASVQRDDVLRNTNSTVGQIEFGFQRLVTGLEYITTSLESFGSRITGINNLILGGTSITQLSSSQANLFQKPLDNQQFRNLLNRTVSGLGPQASSSLLDIGTSLGRIGEIAPNLLSNYFRGNPNVVDSQLSGTLSSQFSEGASPSSIRSTISAYLAERISALGVPRARELSNNPLEAERFIQQELAKFAQPLAEIYRSRVNIANQILAQEQQILNLTVRQVEYQGRAADIGFEESRFRAEQSGFARYGTSGLGILSLNNEQAQAGFRSRLIGLTGGGDTSVAGLGARATDLLNRINVLRSSGNIDMDTVSEIGRLETSFIRIRSAIELFANSTQRATLLQEQLSSVNRERQSRIEGQRRFIFGSDEDRTNLLFGSSLFNYIDSNGPQGRQQAFNTLGIESQRVLLQYLDTFRDVRSGDTTLGAIANQLLGGTLGNDLNQGFQTEQQRLVDQIGNVFTEARQASQILAQLIGGQAETVRTEAQNANTTALSQLTEEIGRLNGSIIQQSFINSGTNNTFLNRAISGLSSNQVFGASQLANEFGYNLRDLNVASNRNNLQSILSDFYTYGDLNQNEIGNYDALFEILRLARPSNNINGFNSGGVVYANNGLMAPRGTDTVPAMLTEGEFVINAASTRANIDLIRRINNARGPLYRQNGGVVYLQNGGLGEDFFIDPVTGEFTTVRPEFDVFHPNVEAIGQPGVGILARQRFPDLVDIRGNPRPIGLPAIDLPNNRPEIFDERNPAFQFNRRLQDDLQRQFEQNNPAVAFARRLREDIDNQININRVRETANFPVIPPDILAGRQQNNINNRVFNQLARSPYNTAFNLQSIQQASILGEDNPVLQNLYMRLLANQFQANQRRFGYFGRNLGIGIGGQFAQQQRQASSVFSSNIAERNIDFFRRPLYADPRLNIFNFLRRGGRRFATGGYVDGPSGGDVIPAYLSDGEYVLNPNTVRAFGGPSTFDNIQRFAEGGRVGGARFGSSQSQSLGVTDTSELQRAMLIFSSENSKLLEAMNSFAQNSTKLIESLNNFPKSIEMRGSHQVEVLINGASVLQNIMPEISELVQNSIQKSLNDLIKTKFPDNYAG